MVTAPSGTDGIAVFFAGAVVHVTVPSAPAKNTAIPSVPLGAVTTGGTYTINVSSLVPTSGGAVTLRGSSTSADGAGYFSKEGSTSSGPRLQLTC